MRCLTEGVDRNRDVDVDIEVNRPSRIVDGDSGVVRGREVQY